MMSRKTYRQFTGWINIILILFFWVAIAATHWLQPEKPFYTYPISNYVDGCCGMLLSVGFLGISMGQFFTAIFLLSEHKRVGYRPAIAMLLAAFGIFLIGIFPMVPPPVSGLRIIVHQSGAILQFLGYSLAMFFLSFSFSHLTRVTRFLSICGFSLFTIVLLMYLSDSICILLGLVQKLNILISCGWLLAFSVYLLPNNFTLLNTSK